MPQRKLSVRETRNILNKIPFNRVLGMKICHVHRDGIAIAFKTGVRGAAAD